MTNPTLPDHGARLGSELVALAPVGGKRRPVKVVEHPAFRAARRRARPAAPYALLRLPVVSLDATRAVARCGCRPAQTTTEAA